MGASNATGPFDRISKRIGQYVNHDDVLVRFVSLWVAVASVFTTSWVLSYLVLPQGLLRGGNPGAATGYAGSVTREFLWLFGWNVGISLIAVAANTLRSMNTPMDTSSRSSGYPITGQSGAPDRSPPERVSESRHQRGSKRSPPTVRDSERTPDLRVIHRQC